MEYSPDERREAEAWKPAPLPECWFCGTRAVPESGAETWQMNGVVYAVTDDRYGWPNACSSRRNPSGICRSQAEENAS